MSPDPQKVATIKNASPPTNFPEFRSLLGMTSYCARYIPDFATVTHPLRELTKKNVKWMWGRDQEKAMSKLKKCLTDETVLNYFDPTKETEVIVGASPVGLAAIMTQKEPNIEGPGRVIACASRAFTDVECRYCQTEREALAIV